MAVDLQIRAGFAQSIQDVNAAMAAGGNPSQKLLSVEKGKRRLEVAYRLLLQARTQNNVPGAGGHLRSPELLVLAAETAIRNGEFHIAREACHEFFLSGGTRDQFFCRALFVKALVVNNLISRDGLVGAAATRRRSRAVGFLTEALEIAVAGGKRYAFLVYNASVHAWNVLRPALRTGRAGNHASQLVKFADALEIAEDPDLRWRCTMLTAVSLALGDSGNVAGSAARAATCFKHAEAQALDEEELAQKVRGVLCEAKEQVALAQSLIRRIEETGSAEAAASSSEGFNKGGGNSAASGKDAADTIVTSIDTEEKVKAALSAAQAARAVAEADVEEATRKLEPLAKAANESSALAERAWLLKAQTQADAAALGGVTTKKDQKTSKTSQAQVAVDRRKEVLLLQQQVTAGAIAGDALLPALEAAVNVVDPEVFRLAQAFASAARGDEIYASGVVEEGGKGESSSAPTPSLEKQSILVDLGRTALRAMCIEEETKAPGANREWFLSFAKACHARASPSTKKAAAIDGAASSVASFRARLEFLEAELASEGLMEGQVSSRSNAVSDASWGAKLDARRSDAIRLSNRVEALKQLEKSLLNCKRLGDPEILQEGCCLAFSIGLPLLGKRHRKHVYRCFSVAAQVLEDLESPLARLRTQLHFEVTRCEMDSDFISKAASHMDKALRQDYGVSDLRTLPPEGPLDGEWDEQPGNGFSEGILSPLVGDDSPEVTAARAEALNDALRPLDRFMLPLADFLRLKTSVDVEPSNEEERAVLLIDQWVLLCETESLFCGPALPRDKFYVDATCYQAKGATDPFLRRTLLRRAAHHLKTAAQAGNRSGDTRSVDRGADDAGKLNQLSVASEEARSVETETAAVAFATVEADGSGDKNVPENPPPSSKRLARLWFALLEQVWEQIPKGETSTIDGQAAAGKGLGQDDGRGKVDKSSSHTDSVRRDIGLARRAAVAVLESGPWIPERNKELVILQTRAQFILGETYVEELRQIDVDEDAFKGMASAGGFGPSDVIDGAAVKGVDSRPPTAGTSYGLSAWETNGAIDPRTMGIPTSACGIDVSEDVASVLDNLKRRACGCFVAGARRALRVKEPALIESGVVYVHNYHFPVWKKLLHHLATPFLQEALEACVGALEAMHCPDTALLCSMYEALARTLSASATPGSSTKAEELCFRAITELGRPVPSRSGTVNATRGSVGGKKRSSTGGKGAGASTKAIKGGGKGRPKKGDTIEHAASATGAATSRRANVCELRGLVETGARCQVARGGAGAVNVEGHPLLKALALLTSAVSLSGTPADEMIESCTTIMREYRQTFEKRVEGGQEDAHDSNGSAIAQRRDEKFAMSSVQGNEDIGTRGQKLDIFSILSKRKGTTLEEDQAELELVGEMWCRLGKERMRRGTKRQAEECCGYVTELLPQRAADRRRVHPRLWRWLAVAEGLWGQAIAAMICPKFQEKPQQDELRRVSMKHQALAAKYGALAGSELLTLDAARRLWNVALPLSETAAGRTIVFSPLQSVLKDIAKGGVVEGGSVRAQLYVLLFECYSDRSEWKQGLNAVGEALQCVPPDFQRPLWQWRVVFLSRLGVTALDGLAKTKESDPVLQRKNWVTLARSSSDPKQQLSSYVKALECLGERFERVECLVEMGEWMTGRGLHRAGADYLRSALDLLYDVEENAAECRGEPPFSAQSGKNTTSRSSAGGTGRALSSNVGLKRQATKRSLRGGRTEAVGSRSSSREARSQGTSKPAEHDDDAFPSTLDVGHLETAVRVLAMLARTGCSSFEERLDVLMQAYFFLGRMAAEVKKTVGMGYQYRLYREASREGGGVQSTLSFEEWGSTTDAAAPAPYGTTSEMSLHDWACWRPEAEYGQDLFLFMSSPPSGRERFAIGPGIIDKAPLLFHHLLDLAENMESQGLAAHAAAPLAICEVVARLCLGPPPGPPVPQAGAPENCSTTAPDRKGKKGEVKNDKVAKEQHKAQGALESMGQETGGEVSPPLVLVCLRRSRLLLKLGPTCQRAAIKAIAAAGPLGVSREEAARRGVEVDRILRQREEELAANNILSKHFPSAETTTPPEMNAEPIAEKRVESGPGRGSMIAPRLGKLEDRRIWALLAKEAVLLGDFRSAGEYLAAAQKHNDAFHDRENVASCLETQAALCEAQAHPDRALPCLLEASALLRSPVVTVATATRCLMRILHSFPLGAASLWGALYYAVRLHRWSTMAIAVAGAMRKSGMGDAKARQVLQASCKALEGCVIQDLDLAGGEAADGEGDSAPSRSGADLDAAVAFSRCSSLLADTYAAVESTSSPETMLPFAEEFEKGKGQTVLLRATNATSTKSTRRQNVSTTTGEDDRMATKPTQIDYNANGGALWDQPSNNLLLLARVVETLRPLGPHPALAAVLRKTAGAWVNRWAGSNPSSMNRMSTGWLTYSGTGEEDLSNHADKEQPPHGSCAARSEASPRDHRHQPWGFLENAVACLAEARRLLSSIAASAEPVVDALSASSVIAEKSAPRSSSEGDGGALRSDNSPPNGGGKKRGAGKGQDKVKKSDGAKKRASSSELECPSAGRSESVVPSSMQSPGVVSTPLGRALVMVQLEEACVRSLLGRAKGEARSEKVAKEATANDEETTPLQRLKSLTAHLLPPREHLVSTTSRYMESTKPLRHPTAQDMALPQMEQALVLAGNAKRRLFLSSDHSDVFVDSGSGSQKGEGGMFGAGMIGMMSLALAWEGSALAMLAARAGLSNGSWSSRPQAPRPITAPLRRVLVVDERDKAVAKKSKTGSASKASSKTQLKPDRVGDEPELNPAPIPPLQEEFDLREQARWKLERAVETSVASKRWDATGVAAFALGELLGGDDASTAAAALMLYQSCKARGRLLRWLHEALPQSNRCRLMLDRVTAAQGQLRGLHILDTSSPHLAPSHDYPETSSARDFPSAECCSNFLDTQLEGWRRLDCGKSPALSLSDLPPGVAVLSLQVSPDGTTLYAAGYSPVRPPSAAGASGDGSDVETSSVISSAAVWRYEMTHSERQILTALVSRMDAFQDSVKRHCLEKCDEEGKPGDYIMGEASPGDSRGHDGASTPTAPAGAVECETELDDICATMESILSPLWGGGVEGGLAPFLQRCEAEQAQLILLLDESLEKMPVEACSCLSGISTVARDFSLHILRHRLKATEATDQQVSNAQMRYVADPLHEDHGVSASVSLGNLGVSAAVAKGAKGEEESAREAPTAQEPCGGRPSILKTLRECLGPRGQALPPVAKGSGGKGASGKGAGDKGGAGHVNVAVWNGVGGDDHLPGIREWQSLISGDSSEAPGGGGFVYYGPGRCLSKFAPKNLAGLSVDCKVAILIDRADNDSSCRLESKQDTYKSREEVELEGPSQTASFFSLAGCQAVVLNMWAVTLHNNRRIISSLFREWGEQGFLLGEALQQVRGDDTVKPRARYCTVLYGLPSLKYGP